jgi:hypothetical protein
MFIQGAAIDRILGEIVHHKGMKSPIDYVLCIGHFLAKVCYHEFLNLRAVTSTSNCNISKVFSICL